MRRVAITGLGVIASTGRDRECFFNQLLNARSGVRRITAFDPERVTSKIAGEVVAFDPSTVLERKEIFGDELNRRLDSVQLQRPEIDWSKEEIWPQM